MSDDEQPTRRVMSGAELIAESANARKNRPVGPLGTLEPGVQERIEAAQKERATERERRANMTKEERFFEDLDSDKTSNPSFER